MRQQNKLIWAIVAFGVQLAVGFNIETVAYKAVAPYGPETSNETLGLWYLSDFSLYVLDASSNEICDPNINILSPLGNIFRSAYRLGSDMHYHNGSVAISVLNAKDYYERNWLVKNQGESFSADDSLEHLRKWSQLNNDDDFDGKLTYEIGAVSSTADMHAVTAPSTSLNAQLRIVRWYARRFLKLFMREKTCYEKEVDFYDDSGKVVFNVLITAFTVGDNCDAVLTAEEIAKAVEFHIAQMREGSLISSSFVATHLDIWHAHIRWRDSKDSGMNLSDIKCYPNADDLYI